MAKRALLFGGGALLAVALSGCPVTDDYYLLPDDALSNDAGSPGGGNDTGATGGTEPVIPGGGTGGGQGAAAQGGSAPGGSSAGAQPSGGSGGSGATDTGGTGTGGTGTGGTDTGGTTATSGGPNAGGVASDGGDGGAGGAPEPPCQPTTEVCNGHDDDCDGGVDEFGVCPVGCSGFVLEDGATVGYMYCTARKDFAKAREACTAQAMRLAWLDSASENQAVSEHLDALGDDAEVLIGATDQVKEGDWLWYGGTMFWKGNQYGSAVNGAFVAWAPGVPDSFGGNEDCAIVNPTSQRWSDRSCSQALSYLCEDVPLAP